MTKLQELMKYSNPQVVREKARRLGYNDVEISSRADKKYMVFDGHKMVHFGQIGYDDFTKSNNKSKRENYLERATKIKGDWKLNKYSPNNLSIHLLW